MTQTAPAALEERLALTARVTGIIAGAMCLGIVTFWGVVVWVTSAGERMGSVPASMRTFSLLNFLALLVAFPLSEWLFRRALTPEPPESDRVQRGLRGLVRVQTAYVLRLAPKEGSALFGLVVCFLCGPALRVQSDYWLNAFPALLFLLTTAVTFPTQARIRDILESRILT